MPKERLVTRTFVLVTVSASFYFTAMGMALPTLPRMVEDDLGGGSLAVGIAAGALAVTAALLRPWVGRTGDRSGRRRLVVLGGAIVAVSIVGHTLVNSVPQLIVFRLLFGAGEAMYFVGAATAAQDLAPPGRQAAAASYFSIAIWGGAGIGPFLAEEIHDAHGTDAVWWVATALVVIATLIGTRTPVGPIRRADAGATEHRPLLHQAAITPGIVLVLTITGLSAFQTFVALHVDELGMSGAGGVFLVYSVIVLSVRIFGASVPDRFGARRVAGAGIFLGAIGLFVISIAPGEAGLYTGVVIMALGISPVYPALLSLVIAATPEDQRGSGDRHLLALLRPVPGRRFASPRRGGRAHQRAGCVRRGGPAPAGRCGGAPAAGARPRPWRPGRSIGRRTYLAPARWG